MTGVSGGVQLAQTIYNHSRGEIVRSSASRSTTLPMDSLLTFEHRRIVFHVFINAKLVLPIDFTEEEWNPIIQLPYCRRSETISRDPISVRDWRLLPTAEVSQNNLIGFQNNWA